MEVLNSIERFLSVSNGNGRGNGNGNGYGVESINGRKVYVIDGVQTIIEHIHGDYASGYTIRYNTVLVPCYIAKVGDCFAHGKTLKAARTDAYAKYIRDIPIEQRIDMFKAEYPTIDSTAKNDDLFRWHNILTGSCKFGREQFCEQHGIDIDGSMTVREFCKITANSYGGEVIEQLKNSY